IKNPFCLTIRGHTETTFLLESSLTDDIEKLVGPKVHKRQNKLVALIVTRELLNDTEIAGLSYPLQVLAEHGVLVIYVAATLQEEIIVVENNAADKATQILRNAMAR